MVVGAVEDRDLDRRLAQRLRRPQAAEAAAQDENSVIGRRRQWAEF
jgi:hypothetical protein